MNGFRRALAEYEEKYIYNTMSKKQTKNSFL